MAARFYGDPTRELRVVGVTGTNGKTTTAFLVRALLEAGGVQTGLLGTVKSVVGGREEPVERTTPEAIDLQATFRRMLDAGDRACAMEVSSHALELGRAEGIHFAARVFTNLTQDHLDFHEDMESYFAAKRRLFEGGEGVAVVNLDDDYGRRLRGMRRDHLRDRARGRLPGAGHPLRPERASSFTVDTPEGPLELETRLPGLFNVQNTLAAVAAARSLGVPLETIRAALPTADRVPGRFEPVDEGQQFSVLVDYAHTPEALDNVLRAARELTRGRLHVVFGAGGDRDRGKRPLMGRRGSELADRVIVTSDNPRSEDPDAIVDEVLGGTTGEAEREVDSPRGAIALAIARRRAGRRGGDRRQGPRAGPGVRGRRKEPFDDVTVAREALREALGVGA